MSSFRDPADALAINRAGWDRVAARYYGGTALPEYGPLAPTEDALRLLDPVAGARVLEIGCGSGHSLRYLAQRGAAELWGLDLSPAQIAFATDVLRPYQPRVRLFESPMEADPGIPAGRFDLVISLYALGWTVDLRATMALIARYLRPGGCLIFSWEHPVYGCLRLADEQIVFAHPYAAQGPEVFDAWKGVRIVQHRRTMSTFVNEVVRAGLQVEALVEGELDTTLATDDHADPGRWYTISRARMMPTTFILKARKPLQSPEGSRRTQERRSMKFTVDELLGWAGTHEGDDWVTKTRVPFSYRVTAAGINYTTGTGNPRNVPRNELQSFCEEFQKVGSFSPGAYHHRHHKSYSLPLIKRFLDERE